MGGALYREEFERSADAPAGGGPLYGGVYRDRSDRVFVVYAIHDGRIYIEYEDAGPRALGPSEWRRMAPRPCRRGDPLLSARYQRERRLHGRPFQA